MSNNVYCKIKNGQIVDGPTTRPAVPEGTPEELKELGWLPWEEVNPPYNNQTHYRIAPTRAIFADKVVFTDVIVPFTDEQMAQNAINDWHGKMYMTDQEMMLRPLEDVITKIGTDGLAEATKKKYDYKRATRATKPE